MRPATPGPNLQDALVVRNEAAPLPRSGLTAEMREYPRGSTENELLMNGARVLTEYGAPQALALYVAIVVRCAGKGECWPSTRVLMGDTGCVEPHGRAMAQRPEGRRTYQVAASPEPISDEPGVPG